MLTDYFDLNDCKYDLPEGGTEIIYYRTKLLRPLFSHAAGEVFDLAFDFHSGKITLDGQWTYLVKPIFLTVPK